MPNKKVSKSETRLVELLASAKTLAREYRDLTGKPLGITGEVAEYEAARLLGLTLTVARQSGFDATQRRGRKTVRLQIKGRCLLPGRGPGQRLGSIDRTKDWDAVLLVLLDQDMNATAIYEAGRASVFAALEAPGSKSQKRARRIVRKHLQTDRHRGVASRKFSSKVSKRIEQAGEPDVAAGASCLWPRRSTPAPPRATCKMCSELRPEPILPKGGVLAYWIPPCGWRSSASSLVRQLQRVGRCIASQGLRAPTPRPTLRGLDARQHRRRWVRAEGLRANRGPAPKAALLPHWQAGYGTQSAPLLEGRYPLSLPAAPEVSLSVLR